MPKTNLVHSPLSPPKGNSYPSKGTFDGEPGLPKRTGGHSGVKEKTYESIPAKGVSTSRGKAGSY